MLLRSPFDGHEQAIAGPTRGAVREADACTLPPWGPLPGPGHLVTQEGLASPPN